MTPSRSAIIQASKLDRAGAADQVTVHGFGRRDHQIVSVRAENIRNGGAFGLVICCGAGAMGVDVTNRIGVNFSVFQRPGNRPCRPCLEGITISAASDDMA